MGIIHGIEQPSPSLEMDIKAPDAKDLEINELMKRPDIANRIQAIAATLAEMFSVQTKLLMDIRPGAVFIDTSTKMEYIYEATLAPFDLGAIATAIFREAKYPLEELKDQGYFTFREKRLNGARHVLPFKEFIKCVAIERFQITDLNIHDEKERTKNIVL